MPRNDLLHLVTGGRDNPSAVVVADQYWDAVVRDESLPDANIDPTLAATILRLQELRRRSTSRSCLCDASGARTVPRRKPHGRRSARGAC